jgi:hypothetical protein
MDKKTRTIPDGESRDRDGRRRITMFIYILLCGVRHVIERRARPDTRPALFSSQQPTPDHLSLSQYVNSGTKTPCIERHNVRPCF